MKLPQDVHSYLYIVQIKVYSGLYMDSLVICASVSTVFIVVVFDLVCARLTWLASYLLGTRLTQWRF